MAVTAGEAVLLAYEGDAAEWAPRAERELRRATRAGARVVVDLSRAGPIDSSMLGALVLAHLRLRRTDGELVLVCNEPARRLLELTGLDRMLACEPPEHDERDERG